MVERLDERCHLLMVPKCAPTHSIKSRMVLKCALALARERVNVKMEMEFIAWFSATGDVVGSWPQACRGALLVV